MSAVRNRKGKTEDELSASAEISQKEPSASSKTSGFKPKKKRSMLQNGAYVAVLGLIGYGCLIGRTFYRICYPAWEEGDVMVRNKVFCYINDDL